MKKTKRIKSRYVYVIVRPWDTRDADIIAVYSSRNKAEETLAELKRLPGDKYYYAKINQMALNDK